MLNQSVRRKLSGFLAASLVAGLMLPVNAQAGPAEIEKATPKTPVLSTVPAADATGVRPDTKIELQLDPKHGKFDTWSKKYQDEVVLTLINDGGQAVFSSKLDSELQYDATSGKLTFQPPAQLNRYTTYGVVISPDEKIPQAVREDKARKTLPKQPAFKVEAVDPKIDHSKYAAEAEARLKASGESIPSVAESTNPQTPTVAKDYVKNPVVEQLAKQVEKNRQDSLQAARSLLKEPELVGPKPVQATDGANRPIDIKEGDMQKGMIKSIEGAVVTLFGGRQFEVSADTKIHVPSLTGPNTLSDLNAGDFVIVTVNAQSQVKNINVTNQEQVVSFVFQTGSALHEPTKVTLEQKEESPRVTEDGHFTLVSTDDYGLPAWGSETKIELGTQDGTVLHESAQVLPSATFTTTSQDGRTDVTIVDHFPQVVVAKISMNGPNYDGYDAHGLVTFFTFRPGLPAQATINAPETLEVGTATEITGEVTDVYGNPVEASEIGFVASAGEIVSPVWTNEGRYTTAYTAATKTQDVTLHLKSAEGNAQQTATIRLLPGAPATMTMEAPTELQAGSSVSLKGQVVDRYNNPVQDGSKLIFSTLGGEIPASATTVGGAYEVLYTAPTKTGLVSVAGASEKGTAAVDREIRIIPGPAANLTLQAQKNNLNTGDTTDLGGQVSDRYDNLIEGQQVDLTAVHGQLSNPAPHTDAAGLYGSVYSAPFYNGVDVVKATAGEAHASIDLNISSAGTGVNPETGAVEKVATLVFNPASYSASPNAIINLTGYAYNAAGKPLQDVVFSSTTATAGTIEGTSYKTDATGRFIVTYHAPASQATDIVTVTSGDSSASATVNVNGGYGYGYNPKTGEWEKVGRIDLETYRYVSTAANQQYTVDLFPGQKVELTGHAYSESGAPLSDVKFDRLALTDGSAELTAATNSEGVFTLVYNTPETEGMQIVQFGSGDVLTTLNANITTYGYGFNPATGAWEPVAQIIFNPSTYTVPAGGSVTLTGKATNAAGQPLNLTRVNLSKTGGQVAGQVITSPNGTFTTTYLAPQTEGTYTVRGYVNSVFGNAIINVTPPPQPYFENPVLNLWGSASGAYWSGYVEWGARVFNGNGMPMEYGVNTNTLIVVDRGYLWHIDFDTPSNGYVRGNNPEVFQEAQYYSVDRYGITYTFYIYLFMRGYDGYHYQYPMINKSYHPKKFVSCYRCYVS